MEMEGHFVFHLCRWRICRLPVPGQTSRPAPTMHKRCCSQSVVAWQHQFSGDGANKAGSRVSGSWEKGSRSRGLHDPALSFRNPGRDVRATALERLVFAERTEDSSAPPSLREYVGCPWPDDVRVVFAGRDLDARVSGSARIRCFAARCGARAFHTPIDLMGGGACQVSLRAQLLCHCHDEVFRTVTINQAFFTSFPSLCLVAFKIPKLMRLSVTSNL